MAALDQVTSSTPIAPEQARSLFKAVIWSWFRSHKNDVLFKKWGFLVITVEMCRPIIEAIAGPETDGL